MRKSISKKEKKILALHTRICETWELARACWQITADRFPPGYLPVISHVCARDWLLTDTWIVDNYGQLKSLQVICGWHMEENVCFGNKFTGRWRSCKGGALIENKIINWLGMFKAGAFTQVALLKRWPIQQVWLYCSGAAVIWRFLRWPS